MYICSTTFSFFESIKVGSMLFSFCDLLKFSYKILGWNLVAIAKGLVCLCKTPGWNLVTIVKGLVCLGLINPKIRPGSQGSRAIPSPYRTLGFNLTNMTTAALVQNGG